MKIEFDLRPCKVGDRKALFHKWSDKTRIVEPSPMIGGHQGGVLKYTVGIVEFENGQVGECLPYEIKFIDDEIKDYCFKEEEC
ncbi:MULTISPECIES: hypothetical protein [Clostridium]|jgi:hypothetical protein|uniref:hypothetical protein n=1 Tax=Clostridium TaxID=1485 RepID=UPI0023302CAE|nr:MULTISPECIES: hypothetical protein [Clostridium]MDB1935121.1 hypothetical protein [Clostridium tertium]MDB1938424.1 hypothetical protein [Clostridium tertium]MDU3549385.1 hypothetical protein [Clostridium sp.]